MLSMQSLLRSGVAVAAFCSVTISAQVVDIQDFFVDVYPQSVVGTAGPDTFEQDLIINNRAAIPCSGAVLLTDGAGKSPGLPILTNGVASGNLVPFTVDPLGSSCLTFSAGGNGLETFATWVEFWDSACSQQLTSQTRYRVNGATNEVFSSPPQPLIPAGSCSQFPVHLEPGANDTGFAAVGIPPWNPLSNDSDLCFQLLDKQGVRQSGRQCQPYDGSQKAFNIGQLFPTNASTGFVGTAEVCYENGAPGTFVAPTAIDVFKNPAGTQLGSSALRTRSPGCEASETVLCLDNGRFKVEAEWKQPSAGSFTQANGTLQPDDSGLFFFSGSDNWELLVKVLDGCSVNHRYWVFAAATTDVEFQIQVTDTTTSQIQTYSNPPGTPSPVITDTNAFATCP